MVLRVIAFVTQKGGSGKSTLAISIAVVAMQNGEKVYILETDRQGTISNWGLRRANPLPDIDQVENAAALEQALVLLRSKGFTLAIIDTPGTDSVTNTAGIRLADLCIIPTRPSPADIEAAHPTLAVIRKTGKQFAFVLNQTPARSFRLNEASAALKMMGALAIPYVALRNDHQDALGAGLGVTEYAPEGKAAEEIGALWGWIKRKLKGIADDPTTLAAQ